jgi:methionyl-tRNA formyltransferase
VTAPARTVFLGSGAFAVPILDALAAHPDVHLAAVVTAPARPAGRGRALHPSPVGAHALARGVRTLTPARLRDPAALDEIRGLAPELLVLADYGRLVPPALLDLPRHGALNLHPSLLPRQRGASPIPAVILAGDPETGVTLMRMDEGLDTGPILAQRRVLLAGDETAPELEARLSSLAAELLAEALPAWLRGEIEARPQDPAAASLTRPLRREDGALDPRRSASELERRVRAYQPWPGSYLDTVAGRIVAWRAEVVGAPDAEARRASVGGEESAATPGRLVAVDDGLALSTTDGWLGLLDVQPAGGRRMTGAALLRGRPNLIGSRVSLPA